MIAWDALYNEVLQLFSENKESSVVSSELSNIYVRYMITGTNILGANVLTINGNPLKNEIDKAFDLNMRGVGTKTTLSESIIRGTKLCWVGVNLNIIPPIPGASSNITNLVTVVGNFNLNINLSDLKLFVTALINGWKSHCSTISGITSGITPIGNPIIFNWNGIF